MTDKDLIVYDYRQHEALLLGMWYEAAKDGSLKTSFSSGLQVLSNFLMYYRSNATLGIGVDEKGIWFACTMEPLFDGIHTGFWIRKDRRHDAGNYKMVCKALDEVFKVRDVVVAAAETPEMQALITKFGCTKAGTIPKLHHGKPLTFYYLTKEEFNERRKRTNTGR